MVEGGARVMDGGDKEMQMKDAMVFGGVYCFPSWSETELRKGLIQIRPPFLQVVRYSRVGSQTMTITLQ